MNVTVANRQRTKKIDVRLLKKIAAALLADLEINDAELGISLVAAAEMARVNWQFLQHEGSTDVITFDHGNSEFRIPNSELKVHGELFICVDDAVLQAKQFRTTWQAEVVRYVVHSVLHLLGHDDHRAADRRKMKREENRHLHRLAKEFPLARLAR